MFNRLAVLVVLCGLWVGCDEPEPRELLADPAAPVAPYDDEPDAGAAADAAFATDAAADASVTVHELGDAAAVKLGDSARVVPVADAGVSPEQTPVVVPPCLVALHVDADRDGFGVAEVTMVDCAASHVGFSDNGLDCYDGNAAARPREAAFDGSFGDDRGDGSFDYDCDGIETPRDSGIATCPTFEPEDNHCVPNTRTWPYQPGDNPNPRCYEPIRDKIAATNEGWFGSVAKCGELAPYGTVVTYSREAGYQCNEPTKGLQIQGCH
jgi:hypothetical protein